MSKLNSSLKKKIVAAFTPENLKLEAAWLREYNGERYPDNTKNGCKIVQIEWQTIAKEFKADDYLTRNYGAGFNHSKLRLFTTLGYDIENGPPVMHLYFSDINNIRLQFCNGTFSRPPRFDRDVEADLTKSIISRFQEPAFQEAIKIKLEEAIFELYSSDIPF